MRTWIPGGTIGTAVVARDCLDQLLQTALVAHLLALVDGGHVCPVNGDCLRGPLGGILKQLEFGCSKDQGLNREPGRLVVCAEGDQ